MATNPDPPQSVPRALGGLLTGAVRAVGRGGEAAAGHAADMSFLVGQSFAALFTGRLSLRDFTDQAFDIGVGSLPLVIVTAILSGIVTSQQGGYQFTGSIPLYILGSVVTSSIILELGPVMTAFVIIGRVGARMTAELGTMKVSEQIDALHALGRDPVRVLAAPRILAGVVVMPVLVGVADMVGVVAGMVAARRTMGLGPEAFLYGVRLYWHDWDFFYSIAKATAFGFVIPLIAVHAGFRTRGGAEGVGRATTGSVVFMILAILCLDTLFPPLLLG
ncbi:MAG: ABC transporter permease [Polyangiaceae bacterium]|nr:ABC transporter permease [Polyangiaceae bacterium]